MISSSARRNSSSRAPAAPNHASISFELPTTPPPEKRDDDRGRAQDQGQHEHTGDQPPTARRRRTVHSTHPHHGANATAGERHLRPVVVPTAGCPAPSPRASPAAPAPAGRPRAAPRRA